MRPPLVAVLALLALALAGAVGAFGAGGARPAGGTLRQVGEPSDAEVAWLRASALRVARGQGETAPRNGVAVATTREAINALARAQVTGKERVLVVRVEGDFVIHDAGPAPGHDLVGGQLVLAFDPSSRVLLDLFMGDFPMSVGRLGATKSLGPWSAPFGSAGAAGSGDITPSGHSSMRARH